MSGVIRDEEFWLELAKTGDRRGKAMLALIRLLRGEVPLGPPPTSLTVVDGVIEGYDLPATPEVLKALMERPVELRVDVWNCRWKLVLKSGDEEFGAEDLGLSKEDEQEFCRMVVEDDNCGCVTWSGSYYPSVRSLKWLAEKVGLL